MKKSKFTIIYDNGKPTEIKVNTEQELKEELKKIFIDIRTDYFAYADLLILDKHDIDITITPYINLIICDIQNERDNETFK